MASSPIGIDIENVASTGSVPPTVAALSTLSDLHQRTGDYVSALRDAEERARRQPASADAHLRVGELRLILGRALDAHPPLERAWVLARADGDRTLDAQIHALLAETHYQTGDFREARRLAQRATKARSANHVTKIRARNVLGKITLGRAPGRAATLFQRNARDAAELGRRDVQAQALTNLGIAQLRCQELRSAERSFSSALHLASESGNLREKAIASENLAVLAHLERDFTAAQHRYHEALSLLRQLGNRPMLARVATNLGELYLVLGDTVRATALSDFAAQLGGFGLGPTALAEILLLQGRVAQHLGRMDDARTAFRAAIDRYRDVGDTNERVPMIELARLEIEEGNLASANEVSRDLRQRAGVPRTAQWLLLKAELQRARGENALDTAAHAYAESERTTDPLLRLQSGLTYAEAAAESGQRDHASDLLKRCVELECSLSARVPPAATKYWTGRPTRIRIERLSKELNAPRLSAPPGAAAVEAPRTRLLGRSPRMRRLQETISRAAPTTTSILILGESGSGKDLVADALHRQSLRSRGPFIKVHCGALPESLLLSELFGHERGAFTDAYARKLGRFELAAGGSLFLDEIGDISPRTQAALLRVLEERRFYRVGGTKPVTTDVRFIAATHRNLEQMVREGTFREDLYFRLRGILIETPPLREHVEDLPLLAEHLLNRAAREQGVSPLRLSREAHDTLRQRAWPGNVRELDNALRSAMVLSDERTLVPEDFRFLDDSCSPVMADPTIEDLVYRHVRETGRSLLHVKKEIERDCIARALDESGGNITKAASLLGMKRPRLSQLVKSHGLLTAEKEQ